MAIKKLTVKQWQKATTTSRSPASFFGTSPGGAAAQLGISRQAVHKAIHRGDLDAIIVNDDTTGRLVMFMIPEPSLTAFKAKRSQRIAG